MNRKFSKIDSEIKSSCPECLTGMLRLHYLTYFTWLDEELITVPNFPAWVCDWCGMREYDSRAVTWLNTLLSPDARGSVSRRRPPVSPSPRIQT